MSNLDNFLLPLHPAKKFVKKMFALIILILIKKSFYSALSTVR